MVSKSKIIVPVLARVDVLPWIAKTASTAWTASKKTRNHLQWMSRQQWAKKKWRSSLRKNSIKKRSRPEDPICVSAAPRRWTSYVEKSHRILTWKSIWMSQKMKILPTRRCAKSAETMARWSAAIPAPRSTTRTASRSRMCLRESGAASSASKNYPMNARRAAGSSAWANLCDYHRPIQSRNSAGDSRWPIWGEPVLVRYGLCDWIYSYKCRRRASRRALIHWQ